MFCNALNLNSKPKITLKKKPDAAAKENSTPLKGFQLWLAENKESLANGGGPAGDEDVNAVGLKRWKDLSKEEKEKYKSPRVPKRKRYEEYRKMQDVRLIQICYMFQGGRGGVDAKEPEVICRLTLSPVHRYIFIVSSRVYFSPTPLTFS